MQNNYRKVRKIFSTKISKFTVAHVCFSVEEFSTCQYCCQVENDFMLGLQMLLA